MRKRGGEVEMTEVAGERRRGEREERLFDEARRLLLGMEDMVVEVLNRAKTKKE